MRRAARKFGCCVAALALCVPVTASAREVGALDEDVDPEDLADIEEEAFGTRGLVRTRAETVSFDAQVRNIELAGNVRVDSPPFHLRSQRIKLSRTKYGIEAEGNAQLAFCPCLGTPLTIQFDKAIVAPPGELILKSPRLDVYGVPVLWLPWFWLRSNDKLGLLPPEVAYRGQDGFYAGGGVHVPWKDRGSKKSLDVLGGGYFDGGFVTDVRLVTPSTSTKVRFDRLSGGHAPRLVAHEGRDGNADEGLAIDARGSNQTDVATVAWDADVIRGRRGVVATTDVETAAKPWDRAAASGSVRVGRVIAETGYRAVTARGGDLTTVDAAGPFAALRTSGSIGTNATYDATVEGGALRVTGPGAQAATSDSMSYGRAEIGGLATTNAGPIEVSLRARGAGDIAAAGRQDGGDRAGTARLRFGIPFARAYEGSVVGNEPHPNDPIVHVIDPFASAAVLHAEGNGMLGVLPGRGLASVHGTAPVTEIGLASRLGRWGSRRAAESSASFGAAYGSSVTPDVARPLLRGRLSATLSWLGLEVQSARVFGAPASGGAVVGSLRVGREDGPRTYTHLEARDGLDPVLARALTDASVEVPAGFLAREGVTGGSGLVIPWVPAVTTSAGVDVDATARQLVAARAGLELRDRCKCLTVRVNGAHRIGRDGVDVWVALDFATGR